MNRVLVFGGRNYNDAATLDGVLSHLQKLWNEPYLVIQGGARGADSLAKQWALSRGNPCITMEAPWEAMGRIAGGIRNGWMIEYCAPNYAVGFPGGPGTANMLKRLKAAGVTTWLPLEPTTSPSK